MKITHHMNIIHRWLCSSGGWRQALEQTMLPWVLERIDLGDNLLELGPGPGLTTDLLRQRVSQMTALEVEPRFAARLEQRMQGTNVRVMQGDATKMPFDNQSFSAIIALTMLHHVPSQALQDRLLTEAYRVLRTNGVFVGIDSTLNLWFRLIHIGDTMVVVDPDGFAKRLKTAGFSNIMIDKRSSRFRFSAYAH